jgi:7-keto-8-aminopelargonate synthetase-like enzyme
MNKFNIYPNELYHSIKKVQSEGCGVFHHEGTEYDGRTFMLKSKEVINFANCSYMGLEKHPLLIEGANAALQKHGTQVSLSRSLVESPLYDEVEKSLKSIFNHYPVVYGLTTLAHYSALPILIKEDEAILLDAYVHNSVRTACEICKARGTFILTARHNDMENLRYLVRRLKKEGYKKIWYLADGIYSMHGDVCNINQLKQLLNEEDDFYAYIDDAHGVSWCGKNGAGFVIGNFGLHEKMIVAGSLSKSFATTGGFLIVPDKTLADYLKLTGHTFIFSSPIPPSSLGAINASLKFHLTPEAATYQQEVLDIIYYFKAQCSKLNIPIHSDCITPIQLIKVGSHEQILKTQKYLIDNGFFPSLAIFPAVSAEDEGLRISLSRHLTKSDIDQFLQCLKTV